jgi:hypothetical protein
MSRMHKFWLWLRGYANKQVRDTSGINFDLQCHHCKTWISEGFPLKALREPAPAMPETDCGRCGQTSYWIDYGIIWGAAADAVKSNEGEEA